MKLAVLCAISWRSRAIEAQSILHGCATICTIVLVFVVHGGHELKHVHVLNLYRLISM